MSAATTGAQQLQPWQCRTPGVNVEQENASSWAHEVPRYECPDDSHITDGLAPEDEVLERMLFSPEVRPSKGINFSKYDGIHVAVEIPQDLKDDVRAIEQFSDANLHPAMIQNIRLCGYTTPTPIQSYSIPYLLAGHNLLAAAQTGISHHLSVSLQ